MAERSGKGAKTLLTVSVIILAATILFSAVYALFISPVTKLGGSDKAGKTDKPSASADELVTPDWMEAERELDALLEGGQADATAPSDEPAEPDTTVEPDEPDEPVTPATPMENPFSDVTEDDWFYTPAMWAAGRGIVSGDALRPNDACARAQVMTFLWRQAGSPEPLLKVSPFTDVDESTYYYKPVLWAFENGLISVPTDGRFNPDGVVTRAQIMLFLYRMEKGVPQLIENPYTDVPEGSYYYDAALWAYSRGIVILGDERTFNADETCTRGQFITFMYRCFAE